MHEDVPYMYILGYQDNARAFEVVVDKVIYFAGSIGYRYLRTVSNARLDSRRRDVWTVPAFLDSYLRPVCSRG